MKAGRRHCENVARLSVGLLIALQIVDSPDGLTAAQEPRAETTAQFDARIDSIPLISIGDGDDDPLYRVIGAVFYGDTLIVAETSTGTLRYYDRATGQLHRTYATRYVPRSGRNPKESQGKTPGAFGRPTMLIANRRSSIRTTGGLAT